MPFDGTQRNATAEFLREAGARIADPARWCQGSLSKGDRVCAIGAVSLTGGREDLTLRAFEALDRIAQARGFLNAVHLNDHLATTHADVLSLFDEAIAVAEAESA